jgi:hypothetical protein
MPTYLNDLLALAPAGGSYLFRRRLPTRAGSIPFRVRLRPRRQHPIRPRPLRQLRRHPEQLPSNSPGFAPGGLQSLSLLGNAGSAGGSLSGGTGGPSRQSFWRRQFLPQSDARPLATATSPSVEARPPPATYPGLAGIPGLPGISGGLFGSGPAGPGVPGVSRIY